MSEFYPTSCCVVVQSLLLLPPKRGPWNFVFFSANCRRTAGVHASGLPLPMCPPQKELETVTVSRLPTTVIIAKGSIDTTEEAIVYVKDLDMFAMVHLLEDTPTGLFLGKPCEENRFSYDWKECETPNP